MSLNNGMLLFDVADEPINGWEENIGTRGYYGLWEKGENQILINLDEDAGVWEVTHDKENGDSVFVDYHEDFDEAEKIAKQYMKEN